MNPNETERQFGRSTEQQTEANSEQELAIQGAEQLESPPEGNFTQGLQAFVAWVKAILAGKGE